MTPEESMARIEAFKGRKLGDMVAAGTRAVGIPPCGPCHRRQAWLNRLGNAAMVLALVATEPARYIVKGFTK
jgi:hypothetical protein